MVPDYDVRWSREQSWPAGAVISYACGEGTDIAPLLPAGVRFADEQALEAFERVWKDLVMRLRGDSWKSTGKAVAELRVVRFSSFPPIISIKLARRIFARSSMASQMRWSGPAIIPVVMRGR